MEGHEVRSNSILPRVSGAQCRETAMVFGVLLLGAHLAFGGVAWAWASLSVLVLALLGPGLFRWPARAWFGLAMALGWASSRLLLVMVFFLLITPIGWIRRRWNGDSLDRDQFKQGSGSVMTRRDRSFTAADLRHLF